MKKNSPDTPLTSFIMRDQSIALVSHERAALMGSDEGEYPASSHAFASAWSVVSSRGLQPPTTTSVCLGQKFSLAS